MRQAASAIVIRMSIAPAVMECNARDEELGSRCLISGAARAKMEKLDKRGKEAKLKRMRFEAATRSTCVWGQRAGRFIEKGQE